MAILAAEDERFNPSTPASITSASRAPRSANLVHGGRRQGASTITMQVARNFFLTSEKTLTRSSTRRCSPSKIENNLTKDQILELYINQIYLGAARLRIRRWAAQLTVPASRSSG
ncbi:MAG: transglycosylase domain-containing protein [Burkholderiales bacterium]|nr:transglycosylase domain-containing protein [Burkholderiales bacterium]